MKVVDKGNSKVRLAIKAQILKGKNLVNEYDMRGGTVGGNNYRIFREKINTTDIKDSGEYSLRVVISYFDQNGKKINLKKETVVNIQNKV